MIKKIELTNFENHKYTVIDNISEYFTLICGESNSGKTSIVRALKLICYNDFNPKSVRVGSEACQVVVETDLGTVTVKRGKKDNIWTIKKNGFPEEVFEKVGKVILPQVSEIIGMDVIKLGDIDIPVNIMDQLEGHFMLSELNGKNASGSVRAQVVDEISGLSGIEVLIKDVSLDKARNLKNIKRLELENEELNEDLIDAAKLKKDEEDLKRVKEITDSHKVSTDKIDRIEVILDDYLVVESKKSRIKTSLIEFDGVDIAKVKIDSAMNSLESLKDVNYLIENIEKCSKEKEVLRLQVKKIPKVNKAMSACRKAEEVLGKINERASLLEEYKSVKRNKVIISAKISKMSNYRKALSLLGKAEENLKSLEDADKVLDEAVDLKEKTERMDKRINTLKNNILIHKENEEEILKDITVCPLTLKPISGSCLKDK
jgi:hypothetical protein